jgi:hypothetical protein
MSPLKEQNFHPVHYSGDEDGLDAESDETKAQREDNEA